MTGRTALIRTACHIQDAGACALLAHVRDGVLVKVEPADFPEPGYRHICARGLAMPRWVYSPDRLKFPLRRAGERCSGKWERISWDEALDTIADRFKKIMEKYGPSAVSWQAEGGVPMNGTMVQRLASLSGGTMINTGGPGDDGAVIADISSFGLPISYMEDGGYVSFFENTRLVVSWGFNVAETSRRIYLWTRDMREQGARFVVIDPRFTSTAAKADEYIPIKPGTDAALAMAMVNVIISQGLQDEKFIASYSNGPFLVRDDNGQFLRGEDIGEPDSKYMVWDTRTGGPRGHDEAGAEPALRGSFTAGGIRCEPAFQLLAELAAQYPLEKASEITGIAPDSIRRLAVDYATCRPAATLRGWGTQRAFHGHLSHRAIIALATVTGNVSLKGTTHQFTLNREVGNPGGKTPRRLSILRAYDTVLTEKPYPIKALWVSGNSPVTQWPNYNRLVKQIFPRLELIVVADLFMTATAEQADIVLPACSFFECPDIVVPYAHPYLQHRPKVIEPLYESRSDFDIVTGLAGKMGYGEYFNKSADEFMSMLLASGHPSMAGITLEKLKQGPVRASPYSSPAFNTPSGRIEFYTERLRRFGEELPVYKEPPESGNRLLAQKYPLIFFTTHTKFRHHSRFANADWLRELDPEPVLEMSTADAGPRGIEDGDMVVVFNDRGKTRLKARVHEGIMPGVVSMGQGWWPGDFVEGSHQVLTPDAINLAQEAVYQPNVPLNDVLVEVCKAGEE